SRARAVSNYRAHASSRPRALADLRARPVPGATGTLRRLAGPAARLRHHRLRDAGLARRAGRARPLRRPRPPPDAHGLAAAGAALAVQPDGADVVSVFGTLYDGVALDTLPALDGERALAIAEQASGQRLGRVEPVLGILPLASGAFALVYTVPVFSEAGRVVYEVDAHTGQVLDARPELATQA